MCVLANGLRLSHKDSLRLLFFRNYGQTFTLSIMTHTMKKQTSNKNAGTIRALEQTLNEAERLWQEGIKEHAYIVGYLEGAIKAAIRELKQ
jgi:hypothetical protein